MKTPYIKKIVELHKIHKAIEGKNDEGGGGGNYTNNVEKLSNGQYKSFDDVPEGFANDKDAEEPVVSEGWSTPPFNCDLLDFDCSYTEFDRVEETNHEMYYNAIYISQNIK